MSEELIKTLQTVIDKRMDECRDAQREAIELANLGIDDDEEIDEDSDEDSDEGSDESEADESDEDPARHPIDVMDEKLRDAVRMMDVARRLLAGRSRAEIHSAFGAPGHWGYGTPIGDALRAFYSAPAPTAPELTVDERIAQAVAAERAACAAIVDQFMIELCGITGDIFSVQYYARDLAQRAVKLAADRIRARGEQRAPIAHAHRCACGKPATHEQCGGLLVCDEHIGPGRAWPIDAKTIELCGDGFNAPSNGGAR